MFWTDGFSPAALKKLSFVDLNLNLRKYGKQDLCKMRTVSKDVKGEGDFLEVFYSLGFFVGDLCGVILLISRCFNHPRVLSMNYCGL